VNHPNDIERVCADCGDPYTYTVAEQRFREDQGMAAPTRCPRCRAERRAQRNADLLSEPAAVRASSTRDRDRRSKGRGTGNGTAQDRYPAICADCGQTTMVPFIPRGDRPVYCRSCFNARRGR
jgi:CxxC-x17-CxxC domain-containing protein